ncbi:MAG: PLP-dependent transferase [Patescibacteria group bacterium]|nr:PLP-dependent transferase [Patescibacteria group bacterium]MDD5221611.1 PLP-dependent transferase [Patescibacteria group bacterium]MDD5396053.1 PLP-dependent transferase [Patescibacteria group bacterium]
MGPEKLQEIKKPDLSISRGFRTVDEEVAALNEFFSGKAVDFYARYGNAGLKAKEEEMAERLGTDNVLLYNSGMSAITSVIENLKLASGDVILYSPYVYGQTKTYIESLRDLGIRCISIDPGNREELDELIKEHRPRAVFAETMANDPEMQALDTQALIATAEEMNNKFKPQTFDEALADRLAKTAWIDGWLDMVAPDHDKRESLLKALVGFFKEAQEKIAQNKSVMGIKGLVDNLKKAGIGVDKYDLSQLVMIIQRSWDSSRQKPLTLILDNTIPTESVKDMGAEIKKAPKNVPIIVVDSGTKFMAQDQATLGIVYSNDSKIMQELETWRAVDGGYIPPSAVEQIPNLSKEEFDKRNRRIIANAKRLAEAFASVVGHGDIAVVSHPNLPGHRSYDYVNQHMPDGSVAVFYIECAKPAIEVCRKLEKMGMVDKIEYGGSFAFEKTRFGIFNPDGTSLRIAAGDESPDKIEEICKIIESL